MLLQIISLIVAGLIALYFLRKDHIKSKSYFGKPRKYSKKEQAILDHYKSVYKPIPKNKNLPSLQRDGFELEDVSLTATQVIYDHSLPTSEEIDKLKEGDLVKLLFTDKDGYAERMWVEVLEYRNNLFKGILRNDANELDGLMYGKTLYFYSNNIYEIDSRH